MHRDEIPPGTLYLLILKTLARAGEMHGYEIADSIQKISDDVLQVEEGSLYPALQRMLIKGWVKYEELAEKPVNLDYFPYTQRPWGFGDFEVRYTGDFAPVAAAVQQTIRSIDRNLPISHVTTLDEQVARSITNQRLVAQLSAFFGLLAVFLSCIGIYGVMSYVVTRRTNEIGIRMALGAGRSNMLWMVLREILILVSIGVVIGVPVTLACDRLVSNMLFGLRPTDPVTLASATVIFLIVATIAGYLPARRASLVDPMVALRYE